MNINFDSLNYSTCIMAAKRAALQGQPSWAAVWLAKASDFNNGKVMANDRLKVNNFFKIFQEKNRDGFPH